MKRPCSQTTQRRQMDVARRSIDTRSLSRPCAERCATTAPRLQGPKDSTGEDQVRSGVNARSWRTERLVPLRCGRLRTA